MRYVLIILLVLCLVAVACRKHKSKTTNNTGNQPTSTLITMQRNGITLTELVTPENFNTATLSLISQSNSEELDNNTIHLKTKVENYTLGTPTNTSAIKQCANSAQGQHIHCIVDGEPYTAHYTEEFKVQTTEGMHTVLCFISRSYHESIKNAKAFFIENSITGKNRYTIRYAAKDLTQPMLFFSRPKGEYKDSETDAVLLDFYLLNCNLSKDGYKVEAIINGNKFILTKWCGYFMEGLPLGKNTIELTLLDKNNQEVASAYSSVKREITLTKTK